MQTFLPSPDFEATARVHRTHRLSLLHEDPDHDGPEFGDEVDDSSGYAWPGRLEAGEGR